MVRVIFGEVKEMQVYTPLGQGDLLPLICKVRNLTTHLLGLRHGRGLH